MEQAIIPLKELPLRNDFMFGQVMRNPRICKLFLEALLGKQIDRIQYIDRQKDLKDGWLSHGIRLDVYLKDKLGTVYNIEMQATGEPGQERRVRYYQSGIDRYELESGDPYFELSESYIIFLCDFDYYKKGLAVYERVSYLKGTDLEYNDGSHAMFLNSHYETGNAKPEILEFLDYIRTNDEHKGYQSQLVKETMAEVISVRNDEKLGASYMTVAMKLLDERRAGHREGLKQGMEKGRKEGRKEGREEGIRAAAVMLKDLVDRDTAIEKLVQQFGLTRETAEEKVAQYWD